MVIVKHGLGAQEFMEPLCQDPLDVISVAIFNALTHMVYWD